MPELAYDRFLEAAPDGVFVVRDGHVALANGSGARLLGFRRPADLEGLPLEAFVDEGDLGAMRQRARVVLETGQRSPPREYRLRRSDGSILVAEVTSAPLGEAGDASLLVFVRDVSERVELRAHLARADRLATLGALVGGVAHEMNNPLTVATLGTYALERCLGSVRDAEARREAAGLVEEIRGAHERLAGIIRELRSAARADDENELASVDVAAALEGALRIARQHLRYRARFRMERGAMPLVRGHASRLRQVFVTLLLSTVNALPDDGADHEVVLRTFTDARQRAIVELRVVELPDAALRVAELRDGARRDAGLRGPGSGLAASAAPLGTALPSTALPSTALSGAALPGTVPPGTVPPGPVPPGTVPPGTVPPAAVEGMSLFVAHNIVNQMGGHIVVESTPGQGTLARVLLPAAETAVAASPRDAAATAVPGRAHILIVDDEPSLALTLKYLLQDRHDVTTMTSGDEALAALRRGDHFDVIVCDLMMPGTTGMDVYAALAAQQPGLEQRMVFMTGGAFTARASEFLARTKNPHLEKPFTTEELEDALQAIAGLGAALAH